MEVPKNAMSKIAGSIQEAAAQKAKETGVGATIPPAQTGKTAVDDIIYGKHPKGVDMSKVKGAGTYIREDAKNAPDLTRDKALAWNGFLRWLEPKGLKGSADLDTGGKGNELFKQYIKEKNIKNLSLSDMPSIRKKYAQLRSQDVVDFTLGYRRDDPDPNSSIVFKDETDPNFPAQKGEKGDYSRYKSGLSENEKRTDPNYVGKYLTTTEFPEFTSSETVSRTEAPDVFNRSMQSAYNEKGEYRPVQPTRVNISEKVVTKKPASSSSSNKSSGGSLQISNY